ncbi:MAG: hypothetical protein K2Q22_14340, partial [Cytophagales bacterium]|nr:hypothetical protein [Cytophagales bacterium]
DVLTGKEIFSSPKQSKYVTDVALSPNDRWLVAAGYSDSAEIHEIPSGRLVKKLEVNADQGSGYGVSVKFSPDGCWLAIGEDNKVARVFNTATWKEIYAFKPQAGWCGGCGTLVNFSQDSKYLVTLSHNDTAKVFDLTTGIRIKSFGGEINDLVSVAFNKLGDRVLVVGDRMALEYDFLSCKTLSSISFDESMGEVNEVVYHPDPSYVIAGFGKNVAKTMAWSGGKEKLVFTGLINEQDKGGLNYDPDNYRESYIAKYVRLKNLLLLSPEGTKFLTGKSGKNAVLWNIASGNPVQVFSGHQKAVICFDWSPDRKYVLTGDGDGEAILWESASGKRLRSFKGHREPIFDIKFNKDEDQMVTTSWDGYMIVWDVKSGDQVSLMDMDNGSAYCASFTPDGLYIVTGRLDKTLEMREPDSKSVVRKFLGHTDIVSSIDFGSNPMQLLTASWDGTARIWDISSGLMIQKFKGSKGALHTAIFSSDGKQVYTAGDDRQIRIYDALSGKLVKTLFGHQAEITSLKISKDGKMLVSYSLDGVIKCWNLEKGTEFYEHIHVGEKDWMARSPEGYFSATGMARSAVHFVKGMEVFQTDQFFEDFYKPNLLPEIFKNKGASNSDRQMGMVEKLQQFPPPTVKLALVPLPGGTEVEVYVKITDTGGGVDEIRLTHNGKILPISKEELVFPSGKASSVILKKVYPMVAGTNLFAASGFSKGRVESVVSESQIFSETATNNA